MRQYGHTIGHAVESVSGFELLHGEAVGVGMIAAGLIEEKMGLSQAGRGERVREILGKLGVSTALAGKMDKKKLVEAIKRDKKAINQWPKFVLLDKIGKVYCRDGQWAVDVKQEIVEKVLDEL